MLTLFANIRSSKVLSQDGQHPQDSHHPQNSHHPQDGHHPKNNFGLTFIFRPTFFSDQNFLKIKRKDLTKISIQDQKLFSDQNIFWPKIFFWTKQKNFQTKFSKNFRHQNFFLTKNFGQKIFFEPKNLLQTKIKTKWDKNF